MPRDLTNSPWGNLSIRACKALRNAGLMKDPEETKKAILEGYPIAKHRMVGKSTEREIYEWAGFTPEPKKPKWHLISRRQVMIDGVILTRSEILAILVAMD
jgi:hypothetical protein